MLLVQLFLAIELVHTGSAITRVCEVFGFQPLQVKLDTNLQALMSIRLQLPRTAEEKLAAESCGWRALAKCPLRSSRLRRSRHCSLQEKTLKSRARWHAIFPNYEFSIRP